MKPIYTPKNHGKQREEYGNCTRCKNLLPIKKLHKKNGKGLYCKKCLRDN